jgi:uncharacterized surface protein with fasciclin (FAS1) repeats
MMRYVTSSLMLVALLAAATGSMALAQAPSHVSPQWLSEAASGSGSMGSGGSSSSSTTMQSERSAAEMNTTTNSQDASGTTVRSESTLQQTERQQQQSSTPSTMPQGSPSSPTGGQQPYSHQQSSDMPPMQQTQYGQAPYGQSPGGQQPMMGQQEGGTYSASSATMTSVPPRSDASPHDPRYYVNQAAYPTGMGQPMATGQQDPNNPYTTNTTAYGGTAGGYAASTNTAMGQQQSVSVLQTLMGTGRHGTFVRLLQVAGLDRVLTGTYPYTVFAPTDEAFDRYSNNKVEDLQQPENRDRLVRFLSYHITSGKWQERDLNKLASPNTSTTLGTIGGLQLPVYSLDTGEVRLSTNVHITEPNLEAGNGMVHEVDTVILP